MQSTYNITDWDILHHFNQDDCFLKKFSANLKEK